MNLKRKVPRPHRARRGEGERLREELLDAAERLLLHHGAMDRVSVRAIAQEVGVTSPSLYLHFADKDELFFHLCTRRFAEFGATVLAAIEDVEGIPERLEAAGRAYVRYGLEHPEHYRILFGQRVELPPSVEDHNDLPGAQALHVMVALIEAGVREGTLRPCDPRAAALGLWSTVHGFVDLAEMSADLFTDLDRERALDQVLAQSLGGLLAAAPSGR